MNRRERVRRVTCCRRFCDRRVSIPDAIKRAWKRTKEGLSRNVAWGWLTTLLLVMAVACSSRARDDSRYVRMGPRTGYYIVRPGSALDRQLGLEAAPTSDTGDPFRHGYGADALAFRFDAAGRLAAPPAYIVQAIPNEFYTRRLGSFIRGVATSRDVEGLFGRPQRVERRPDGVVIYYALEVYNPAEARSGAGRR